MELLTIIRNILRIPYIRTCIIIYLIIWPFNWALLLNGGGIEEKSYVYFEKPVENNAVIRDSIIHKSRNLKDVRSKLSYIPDSLHDDRLNEMYESGELNRICYDEDLDSVITTLYLEGKLEDYYKNLIRIMRSPSHFGDYQFYIGGEYGDGNDTLATVRRHFVTFYGLNYNDMVKRNKILRDAMIPLGYTERISAMISFAEPPWDTEYSDRKLFYIWLIGYIGHGLSWNPIMFICLPVGIGFLIFSRNARRQTVTFLRRTFNKLKQWFRLR